MPHKGQYCSRSVRRVLRMLWPQQFYSSEGGELLTIVQVMEFAVHIARATQSISLKLCTSREPRSDLSGSVTSECPPVTRPTCLFRPSFILPSTTIFRHRSSSSPLDLRCQDVADRSHRFPPLDASTPGCLHAMHKPPTVDPNACEQIPHLLASCPSPILFLFCPSLYSLAPTDELQIAGIKGTSGRSY